jgi:hypothetical protein
MKAVGLLWEIELGVKKSRKCVVIGNGPTCITLNARFHFFRPSPTSCAMPPMSLFKHRYRTHAYIRSTLFGHKKKTHNHHMRRRLCEYKASFVLIS